MYLPAKVIPALWKNNSAEIHRTKAKINFLWYKLTFMILKKSLLPVLAYCFTALVCAQGVYAPLDRDYYHLIDRYEIKSGQLSTKFFTTAGQIRRQDIAAYTDDYTNIASPKTRLSKRDRFNLRYLQGDNWEWSKDPEVGYSDLRIRKTFFKHFYKRRNAFLSYETRDSLFEVQFNPVFYGSAGFGSGAGNGFTYINTRAFEVRGMIGRRLGFYTFFSENQSMEPAHVRAAEKAWGALPGYNFYKDFGTNGAYDYFNFRGYLTFSAIKDVLQFQFGHDQNRIGAGYRSLLLDNFAPSMLFFKTNLRVWKFNYQWMLSQGMNNTGKNAYTGFDKKYFSMHHLSFNIGKHTNIGVFEAITNGAQGASAKFEWNYLNPILIYRSVEAYIGNKNAAMIGMDFKVNFLRHVQVYGQLAISELNFQELKKRNGWFGNQQSFQLGAKYIDAFTVKNLDLQAEFNYVRPFMYTDRIAEGAYTHYNQPLAHPLGANVAELVGVIRYQPVNRLQLRLEGFYALRGLDKDTSVNYGSNLLLPYTDRTQDYGNYIGTGIPARLLNVQLSITYMARHNLFVDLGMMYRRQSSAEAAFNTGTAQAFLSVRLNMARRQYMY